jgi:hypothetical protein
LQQLLRIFDMAKPMPPKGVNTPGRLTVSTDQMPQDTFVQVSLGCGQQAMPTEIQAPAHPLQTPIYLIAAPKKMQNITRAVLGLFVNARSTGRGTDARFHQPQPQKD